MLTSLVEWRASDDLPPGHVDVLLNLRIPNSDEYTTTTGYYVPSWRSYRSESFPSHYFKSDEVRYWGFYPSLPSSTRN